MLPRSIAALILPAVLFAAPVFAQDSDADGIADDVDAFPCDANYAGVAFSPGGGLHNLLMFEDQWPRRGDTDFNDVVVSYANEYLLDGNGDVVRLTVDLTIQALSGNYDNGLALGLPIAKSQVASVTLVGVGSLVPSAADANLVVTISDDMRALLNVGPGPVLPSWSPYMQVVVDMVSPVSMPFGEAPHDLHMFRVGQPGLQVHRSAYGGTANVDNTLFGTNSDASQPGNWYMESNGLPFVFDLPMDAAFPKEGVTISALYPDIVTYAASGGTQAADFYTSTVNAAVGTYVFGNFVRGQIPTVADTSCVAQPGQSSGTAGPSCSGILSAGQAISGVYWIDPDGSGGLAPYEAYCDQTTQGGGWILAIANRRQSAATLAIDGVVTPSQTQRALNDARWQYLRGAATQALATSGTTQIVADMASLRSANCQALATTLTAPMLAHAENSGCSGTGTDYSLWFGYRNSWGRANAIYDYSGGDFYPGAGVHNLGTASMWVR